MENETVIRRRPLAPLARRMRPTLHDVVTVALQVERQVFSWKNDVIWSGF